MIAMNKDRIETTIIPIIEMIAMIEDKNVAMRDHRNTSMKIEDLHSEIKEMISTVQDQMEYISQKQ